MIITRGSTLGRGVGSRRREGEGYSIETERVLGDIYTYMYDYSRHTSSNHIGRRFFIKERERDRGEDSEERT